MPASDTVEGLRDSTWQTNPLVALNKGESLYRQMSTIFQKLSLSTVIEKEKLIDLRYTKPKIYTQKS